MSALKGDVKNRYYGVLMRSGRCWDADEVEPFHSDSVEVVLAEAKQYNWNFPEYDYLFVYDENNLEVVEARLVNAEWKSVCECEDAEHDMRGVVLFSNRQRVSLNSYEFHRLMSNFYPESFQRVEGAGCPRIDVKTEHGQRRFYMQCEHDFEYVQQYLRARETFTKSDADYRAKVEAKAREIMQRLLEAAQDAARGSSNG